MATLTMRNMGIDEEIRKMNLVMQTVSREGKLVLEITNNPQPMDLMANRLVQYYVLTRNLERNMPVKQDCFVFSEGGNFAEANIKWAYEFVEQEKKRLNPNYVMNLWNKINNSTIISGAIGAALGSLFTWFLG